MTFVARDSFDAVVHAGLAVDVPQAILHCIFGRSDLLGDIGVLAAFRHERNETLFARA